MCTEDWRKKNWGVGIMWQSAAPCHHGKQAIFLNPGSLKKVVEVQMGPSSTFPMSDLQSEEF